MSLELDYLNKDLLPQNVDIVIYHGKCSDGFGSALASYIYFKSTEGKNANGMTVEYFPASFNVPPPNVIGKNVLICDFSYKKDIMLKMIEVASSVLIIDHHKTAKNELESIPDKNKIFRMDHSGAYLTWKYFFPYDDTNNCVPLLIKYIEDNDIWLKQMPNTREVTSYIFSLPFEFEEYEKLLDPDYITTTVIPIAIGMNKQNVYYTDQAMSNATVKFVEINKQYYFVAHLNSTVLKSEIGNQILQKYPNCDFSAIYSINDNITSISLRSEDNRADVSEIAKVYGGGGHRNAAGMTVFNSTEFGHVLDDYVSYSILNNIYIIQSDSYNAVYLNATNNKKQLGKYLLQTRYIEPEIKNNNKIDKQVQQWCSIMRNKTKKNYVENTIFCEMSCIWYYDGENNQTWFLVTCVEKNSTDWYQTFKNMFSNEKCLQLYENDRQLVFCRKGLVSRIAIENS